MRHVRHKKHSCEEQHTTPTNQDALVGTFCRLSTSHASDLSWVCVCRIWSDCLVCVSWLAVYDAGEKVTSFEIGSRDARGLVDYSGE